MHDKLGLNVIIWTAVIYVLFIILSIYNRYFLNKTPTKKLIIVDILLIIKDQEQIIESIIRSAAEMIFSGNINSKIINLIVVDDYSVDQTPEILRILGEKYNFLKVVRMGKIQDNRTPIEVGISICEGEVICILDANSRIAADRIKSVISYFVNRDISIHMDENVEIKHNPKGGIGLKT